MHPPTLRKAAHDLHSEGHSPGAIARSLGVGRTTVRDWLSASPGTRPREIRCFRCNSDSIGPPAASYLYLLGQYLGDGHLVMTQRIPKLRVACADSYPAIAAEVDACLRAVSANRVQVVQRLGCTERSVYWTHWPCLLPQHGPGRKHERLIRLEPWQQELADAIPWPLIRGLIHSDGCRSINTITRRGHSYHYPRYFFSNESPDIIGIFTHALDTAGVGWRMCRPNLVSVARRADVELLDRHIGPKT